jgi:hypothetical protein
MLERLSHTPGQAYAPKSGQKLLAHKWLDTSSSHRWHGGPPPLRAPFEFHFGQSYVLLSKRCNAFQDDADCGDANARKQTANGVTDLGRGADDYVNPFLGLMTVIRPK